jgi:hypothetical protein
MDREAEIVDFMFSVRPVQARRALRCVSFQSIVPSRWRMQKDVLMLCVDIRREIGSVEVICWYKKGMPRGRRRRGERRRRVEITVSGEEEEERATREPRRAKRGCEGESVALRRE